MLNIPADADLDASVQLIAFMWDGIAIDAATVTPEVLAIVRFALAQNFHQLPPDLQMLFANGRVNNKAIQAEWNAAEPGARLAMAQQFQQLLALLGLMPTGYAGQAPAEEASGQSLNVDIASNIAWNASGAGDWNSR